MKLCSRWLMTACLALSLSALTYGQVPSTESPAQGAGQLSVEIEQLKQSNEQLQRALAAMEARMAAQEKSAAKQPETVGLSTESQKAPSGSASAPDKSGTTKRFSKDIKGTDVQVGGFVQLMTTYDVQSRQMTGPTLGEVYVPFFIPLKGTADATKPDMKFSARLSSFFIQANRATPIGKVHAYLEGDFMGENATGGPGNGGDAQFANSWNFRLRHAYVDITKGKWTYLAGQTWSTFMDLQGLVPSMDYAEDPGTTFVRQAQVRLQYKVTPSQNIQVAVENPDRGMVASGPVSLLTNAGTDVSSVPDIIVKYWLGGKWGHVEPKILISRFEESGKKATGWGFSFTSQLRATDRLAIYLGGQYGDGMSRYGGLGMNSGVGLTAAGKIATVKMWGAYAGTTVKIMPRIQWNTGGGYFENDDSAFSGRNAVLTSAANKNAWSWHSNVKWTVAEHVQFGWGFVDGKRKTFAQQSGHGLRTQFFTKYTF